MILATRILALIFTTGGLTSLIAGLTGASWFFSAASSRTFTGRRLKAARILYSVAGTLMIAVGLSLFLN